MREVELYTLFIVFFREKHVEEIVNGVVARECVGGGITGIH